jgi:DhnA family fructose-bisphosphate aldolase class Ia
MLSAATSANGGCGMEVTGRERRTRRLFSHASGRAVFLPIDQPVSLGPIAGVRHLDRALPTLLRGRPDALIAHRGVLRRVPAGSAPRTSLILHLSAGTQLSGRGHVKVLTGDVEDAVRLGADAVSVQVTFGTPDEHGMLADLTRVASSCARWSMPLLAMVYVHGGDPARQPDRVAHAARVAAELGSDIVKVPWTGSTESFQTVVCGCFTPVVVAGGERCDGWDDVCTVVKSALAAGAAGVCIGRNVFQHDDPARALADIRPRRRRPTRTSRRGRAPP